MMCDKQLQQDFYELFSENSDWIDSLNQKSILITGATGLIGSIIGRAILYYNRHLNGKIQLICHVRNIDKARTIYGEEMDSEHLSFCIGDIDDGIHYDGTVNHIIHCANTTSSKAYVNEPVETIRTIVIGTDKVLQFALSKKVDSIVYLSSMETYGSPKSAKEKITEKDSGYMDTMSVRSSYSEGKRLAECMCASYASEFGLNAVVARLAQVFGAGVSTSDNRVFIQLAKSAIEKKDFVMHSDGSSYGNYCYTTDAVKALLMLLSCGKKGEAYNIVNEDNCMTIREMAEMVSSKVAEGAFNIVYDIPKSNLTYGYAPKVVMHLSSEKMNRLGWHATVPLEEMYVRMISSLREHC